MEAHDGQIDQLIDLDISFVVVYQCCDRFCAAVVIMARPTIKRRKTDRGDAGKRKKKNLVTKGSANKQRQVLKPLQRKGKEEEEEELPAKSRGKEDEIQLEDFLDFGGEGTEGSDDESIASDDDDAASSAGTDISSLDSEAEAAFMKSIDQLGKSGRRVAEEEEEEKK